MVAPHECHVVVLVLHYTPACCTRAWLHIRFLDNSKNANWRSAVCIATLHDNVVACVTGLPHHANEGHPRCGAAAAPPQPPTVLASNTEQCVRSQTHTCSCGASAHVDHMPSWGKGLRAVATLPHHIVLLGLLAHGGCPRALCKAGTARRLTSYLTCNAWADNHMSAAAGHQRPWVKCRVGAFVPAGPF